jgi:hypothetical protein
MQRGQLPALHFLRGGVFCWPGGVEMASLTKNQKIAEAIKLIENITRAQYVTGAIMGGNTNTIMAVELLKDAMHSTPRETPTKPRKKKTPVQMKLENLEQPKEEK